MAADPAARLRLQLADAKQRGRGFDWSWRTARTAALGGVGGRVERAQRARALGATRGAWRRAYLDAEPAPAERAAAGLLDALTDTEPVGGRGTLVA